MPTVVDPNNPLGLDLSPAGQAALAVDLRGQPRDPDLGWSDNMGPTPVATADQLSPDLRNQIAQAERNWANMDQAYYSAREQNPLPLVLGAAGLIAAPFALSALGLGAGAGAAGAGAADAATGGALGAGTVAGTAGALGGAAAGIAPTVSELVVTAAANGLSIPAIAATLGVPAATVGSILSGGSGSDAVTGSAGGDTVATPATPQAPPTPTVDPLTVTAPAATGSVPPVVAGLGGAGVVGALGAGGGGGTPIPTATVDPLTVTAPPNPGTVTNPLGNPLVPAAAGAGIGGLIGAITSGSPSNIGDWIKANPVQAAALGLTVAGALGGGTPNGTGSFAVPSGNGAPGTPSSLNPNFSAGLPPPTFGQHTLRPLPNINWNRYAIEGPAQSFFNDVPQSPAPQFAVMTRPQTQQNAADRLGYSDISALRKAFAGPGYAKGGRMDFAVHGAGTGRSDSIPARLSDGEYVVDAETVSMLGDGSNKAGAQKLDKMRVNLRKAKGKQLAKGRFSVAARDPEHYYRGGRTDA